MLKFILPLLILVSFFASGQGLEIPDFSGHHSFQELQSSKSIILRSEGEKEQKSPSLENLFLLQTHHFIFVSRVKEFHFLRLLTSFPFSVHDSLYPRGPPSVLV